jgi:hypothetical protein
LVGGSCRDGLDGEGVVGQVIQTSGLELLEISSFSFAAYCERSGRGGAGGGSEDAYKSLCHIHEANLLGDESLKLLLLGDPDTGVLIAGLYETQAFSTSLEHITARWQNLRVRLDSTGEGVAGTREEGDSQSGCLDHDGKKLNDEYL